MERTVRAAALSPEELRRKKTSFTLDLASTKSISTTPTAVVRPRQDGAVLGSPDVGLLALATPDLERFILQQAYGAAAAGATTPPGAAAASIVTTPTQILFPRSVTEEQEAYARGFLDALVELHRQQRHQAATSPMVPIVPDPRAAFVLPCASSCDERSTSVYTTLTSVTHSTAVGSTATEVACNRTLPEFMPSPHAPPPFSGLRPSSLNLSPAARRSAVMPSFDTKRMGPFVGDCETLDLSPSGRYANRTLEHSATPKSQSTVSTPTTQSSTISPHPPVINQRTMESVQQALMPPVISQYQSKNGQHSIKLSETEVHEVPAEPTAMITDSGGSEHTQLLPTHPIDMSIQEQAKIERKREKNRYAAQKCRMLKLERIDRLQHRVDELKSQNAELSNTASELCDHVKRLRQMIVEHVEGGCQVMMVHSGTN